MLYVSEAKQMRMFMSQGAWQNDSVTQMNQIKDSRMFKKNTPLSFPQILTISIRIPVYIHQILFDPPPLSHGLLITVEKNHTF